MDLIDGISTAHESVQDPSVDAPVVEAPSAQIAAVEAPIASGSNETGQFKSDVQSGPPIPGPLGIDSASLKGKIALVTGAGMSNCPRTPSRVQFLTGSTGRGIGREMALELGRRGAKVVVNYRHSDAAAMEVVNAIKSVGSDAIAIKANVSVVKEIMEMFAQAVSHFGELNIVCSNSGVVSFGHIKDVTEEEYDRVMNTNTRGQFFVAREAYKHLSFGGRLILMGSITGQAKAVPRHACEYPHAVRGDMADFYV
jgi:tetrahydroxynaphthalene reductase